MLIYTLAEPDHPRVAKGVAMKAEAVGKDVETKIRESVRCSSCNRTITNPKESVRSRQRVMCAACYESLLNPSHHCCCSGAAV